MIKNNIAILLLVLGVFCFTSCEDETVKPFEEADLNAAYLELGSPTPNFFNKGDYSNTSATFSVNAVDDGASVNAINVLVYYTTAGADPVGPVNLGTVNSLPGDFTVDLSDMFESGFSLTADDLKEGDVFDFFFEMETSVGTIVQGGPVSARNIKIPVSCPSDLAGIYSTEATYGAHDFLATSGYDSNSETDVEITEVAPGVYSVVDFSGGLYATGPYNAEYGTTDLPITFSEVCANIVWSDQSDPWQPLIQNPANTSFVDPATGVITISWVGETYGETVTVVYTPM